MPGAEPERRPSRLPAGHATAAASPLDSRLPATPLDEITASSPTEAKFTKMLARCRQRYVTETGG